MLQLRAALRCAQQVQFDTDLNLKPIESCQLKKTSNFLITNNIIVALIQIQPKIKQNILFKING